MIVRVAVAGDADKVAELNGLVHARHVAALPWLFKPEGLSAKASLDLIESEKAIVCVAEADREVAGYIYAELRAVPETELKLAYRSMHVHHLSVAERFHKSGVGRALVDHVVDLARHQDVRVVTSSHWTFNRESAAFFAALGFEQYHAGVWRELSSG